MAGPFDQQTNGDHSVLTVAIGAHVAGSTVTIQMAGAIGVASAEELRVQIGRELFLVTSGMGTSTLTATAAIEGTAAATHVIGDAVVQVLTAGGLENTLTPPKDHGHTGAGDGGLISVGVTAHSALTGLTVGDDHTQYQKESEKGEASGYAPLGSGLLVPVGYLGLGTANSTTFLRGDGTWAVPPSGGGAGTVTSVALTVPSDKSVAGSPVTASGTLAITDNNQSANRVKAGPTTGSAAAPGYRALVAADLPATAVTPGSYTNSDITVDAAGRLTAASSGSGGGSGITNPMTAAGDLIGGDRVNATNIALNSLGITASASGGTATGAFDGSDATNIGTIAGISPGFFVRCDFGTPQSIVAFRYLGSAAPGWKVQSSPDGSTWTDRLPTFVGGADTGVLSITAGPFTARYWQIISTGNHADFVTVNTVEFRSGTPAGTPIRLAASQTLTDGATISWDASLAQTAQVTLGGNRTLAAPTNLYAGRRYHLIVIQDGTGSRTLTWNTMFKFPTGTAPTLTTAAAGVDVFEFVTDGTNLYQITAGKTAITPGSYTAANITVDALGRITTASNGVAGGGSGLYSAYLCYQDQKSNGTGGGTFTSGAWRTRDLNTEVTDTGNNGTLASNQITLLAGTYYAVISAPAFNCQRHKARLQDITNGVTLLHGTSECVWNSSTSVTRSLIIGRFTLSATTVIEVQHECVTTNASNGFGVESSFGDIETYTIAEFWKV